MNIHPPMSSTLAVVLLLGSVTAVRAQDGPDEATLAAARQLGERGIRAYWSNDFASAVDKLDRGYSLAAIPTLGLWSARARVKLGRLVEGAERYRDAMRSSIAIGDSAAQQEAQRDAARELTELNERIPSLTVLLHAPDPAAVTITLDDVPLPSALVGESRPINPGTHRVVASAGSERYENVLEVAEREHKTSAFEFRMPEAPSPLPATASAQTPEPVPAAPPPSKAESASSGVMKPIAIVALSLGGASLIASGISALAANDKRAGCPNDVCNSETLKSYESLRTLSTVTFYAGVGLAAGGLIMWLLAPGAVAGEQRVQLNVGPTALSMAGRF